MSCQGSYLLFFVLFLTQVVTQVSYANESEPTVAQNMSNILGNDTDTKPVLGAITELSEDERRRDHLIGTMLKNSLENYHFSNKKLDYSISQKAFPEYLKRLDYGKQFLLASDVKELRKQDGQMHEQLITGDLKLMRRAQEIIAGRIEYVEKLREEFFKTQFDFTINEDVELDPDKREFPKNETELKEHWRKIFKQATLNNYLSLIESQKELDKPKDEKSAKKDNKKNKKDKKKDNKKKDKKKNAEDEKKLTDKEMREKAHTAIADKYKQFFNRLSKEEHFDHLEKFVNAIGTIYDPHTVYMPPKRKEDFDIDISGKLEGIGAVLQEDGPHIKVVTIVTGGAAWRQKELEVDDLIIAVAQKDGEPFDLINVRVDDAVRHIRGPKGSEVRLTVKKPDGSRKIIPIIRDVVQIGASYAKSSVLEHDKMKDLKIGYINLPKFYRDFSGGSEKRNCTEDVKNELIRLKQQKVDGVILDLRGNGGGALEDARLMSGLFVERGPIVQIKGHDGRTDILADNDPTITYDGPLIVLTNRFSASASEILAGAMQDYGRAVIIGGETTHGKGTVQAILDFNQGPLSKLFSSKDDRGLGALKITIQKFYRVNGGSTQYKGITPDIILPDPFGYTKSREQDLDFSLPWDQVKALDYKKWDRFTYDLSILKERSLARVAKDERFVKIKKSVNYFSEKRNETKVSLNIKEVQKKDEEAKKISEELKLEDESEALKVSHYEASLKEHENIKPGEEKQWKEDFEQRSEEWVQALRRDAVLEESLFIMDDIIKSQRGQKLGMAPKK